MKRRFEHIRFGPGKLFCNPAGFLACGLGTGLVPVAPGTAGTALGVGLYLLIMELPLPWYAATVLFLFCLGIGLTRAASRLLAVHDHPAIVWDEIVGYLVTMMAAPRHPGWILTGFVFFRIFDILKPWPIYQIDRRITGGLGIMLDDLVAGIYAWALLQGAHLGLKFVIS
ncbi:MAG: phosphatidylglycerophosphatase A [Gammaproteobacteria bacterium]